MASTITSQERAHPDLEWLIPALWPEASPEYCVGTRPGWTAFVANPSVEECHLLVPLLPSRAASQAVRRYHDGASLRSRLTMSATETALRLGVGRLLTPRIVSIEQADSGIVDAIEAGIGRSIGSFGVTLGPRRANRKPVLQLFDAAGDTVGFAKIAVDDFTSEMVARESTWIARAAASGDPALRVPEPLWVGDFDSRPISVIGASWALRRRPRATRPSPSLVRAIHRLSAPRRTSVGDSSPALALRGGPCATARLAIELASERLAHPALIGAWHGDLTPWNLLSTRDGRVTIDWETAEDGHPLGADALHHEVAVAMQLHGQGPAEALGIALQGWPSQAIALGLTSADARAVVDVLLLEYVRRDLDLADAGRTESGLGAAAMRVLEQ